MFDDEIEKEKKPKGKKTSPKEKRLGTGSYGFMPQSYVYGKDYPTCWLHGVQKQVF